MCVHDAGPLTPTTSSNSRGSAAGSSESLIPSAASKTGTSSGSGSKKKENFGFLRRRLLVDLVQLFALNRPLLEAKGALILRRLCLHLDGRVIYCALARILLYDVDNREFSSLMVELLNLILLTAVELTELRELLRGCASAMLRKPTTAAAIKTDGEGAKTDKKETTTGGNSEDALDPTDGFNVFLLLYRTWCVNPVATVALCLLTEAYDLGARLIARFAETTISVGVLLQCDKLVQLLETPIFIGTRLHLTQPHRPDHGHLLRLLYGLLMVLPQGTAYATLRDRLTSVTSLHICLSRPSIPSSLAGAAGAPIGIDGLAPSLANVGTYTTTTSSSSATGNFSGLELNPAWGSGLAFPHEGASGGTAGSGPSAGFDLDEVFSSFSDSQAVYRAALVDDLRARSLLHNNARRPMASTAAAASTAPSATAATTKAASASAASIKAASLAESTTTASSTAAEPSSQSAAAPTAPSTGSGNKKVEETSSEAGSTSESEGEEDEDESSSEDGEKESSGDEGGEQTTASGTETGSRR
jgi:Vacuolar protein 14 C-terminal Fig4p binding